MPTPDVVAAPRITTLHAQPEPGPVFETTQEIRTRMFRSMVQLELMCNGLEGDAMDGFGDIGAYHLASAIRFSVQRLQLYLGHLERRRMEAL